MEVDVSVLSLFHSFDVAVLWQFISSRAFRSAHCWMLTAGEMMMVPLFYFYFLDKKAKVTKGIRKTSTSGGKVH